jgi:hypothetical protein
MELVSRETSSKVIKTKHRSDSAGTGQGPSVADVRQSAVPHETPSGRVSPVSPNHPIMITKGNNIAGEVACLRMLLGAPGFPFEVGIARAIKRIALTHLATQLVHPATGAVLPVYYPQTLQQEDRVGHKHIPSSSQHATPHQSPLAAPPNPYHDAPVR